MKTSMAKKSEIAASPEIMPVAQAEKHPTVNRRSVLLVLERAAEDEEFIRRLTQEGSSALEEYGLSSEEKAALISGDLAWIEAHVGTLTQKQKTWLNCRLQQERW